MPRRTVYHLLFTPFQVEVIKRRWPGPAQARTYLLRLMRDRGVDVARPQRKGWSRDGAPAPATPRASASRSPVGSPVAPLNGNDGHRGLSLCFPDKVGVDIFGVRSSWVKWS